MLGPREKVPPSQGRHGRSLAPRSQHVLFYCRAGRGNWDSQQVQAGCGWKHLEELAQTGGSVQQQWERGHTTAVTRSGPFPAAPQPVTFGVGQLLKATPWQLPRVGRSCFPQRQPRGSQHCRAPICIHASTSQVPAPLALSHAAAAALPSPPWCQGAGEALGGRYVLLPWPLPLCCLPCHAYSNTRELKQLTLSAQDLPKKPALLMSTLPRASPCTPQSQPLSRVPTPSPGGEHTTVLLASSSPFPLQKQLKYAARCNLPETLPYRPLT